MITLGHVIAAIICIFLYQLVKNILTFIKYTYEGKEMNGLKFVSYLVKVVIIGAMLANMYPHFITLAEFIQGLTVFTMGSANYYTGVIEIVWLVGLYFGACLLEMAIGFGIIFPLVRNKINNHRF